MTDPGIQPDNLSAIDRIRAAVASVPVPAVPTAPATNPPKLRADQVAAIDHLRTALRAGKRRLLLVAPCAFGKTVVLSAIAASFIERSKEPVIILVHRTELVNQTLDKLHAHGISAGVLMGADKRARPSMVQVASVPTLHRRLAKGLPPAGLVIVDECHHACSKSYRELLAAYPSAICIGVTATPVRADGQGLGDIFEQMVVAASTRELIERGSLSPVDCFAYDAPELHEVPVVAGDYKKDQLEAACNTSILVGSSVREYLAHASGRRALVYAVGVEHSKSLASEFAAAGVPAAHLDQSTPKDERAQMIENIRTGKILALCSVGCLTEGLDVPSAEVCILARPTKSLSLYLQMAGRVLRTAPGKQRALLHSHDGNVFRHGFPDDDRAWALEGTPPRQARDLMACTDCGYLTARWPADGLCPKCGSVQNQPEEQRVESDKRRGKEQIEGQRLNRAEIERIIARAKEISGRDLTPMQAEKVSRATREEKAAEYLRLCQVRDAKSFQKGFEAHQYRATFGVWPHFADGELDGVEPAERPFLPLPPRQPSPLKENEP